MKLDSNIILDEGHVILHTNGLYFVSGKQVTYDFFVFERETKYNFALVENGAVLYGNDFKTLEELFEMEEHERKIEKARAYIESEDGNKFISEKTKRFIDFMERKKFLN